MWFKDEVLYPRFVKSFLWMILLQEGYLTAFILVLKIISWHPLFGVADWVFYLLHWKTLLYQIVLCLTTVAFGISNLRFYTVEKHICSTRFEKICTSLSPHYLQHVLITTILGGIAASCLALLFHNFFVEKKTFIESSLTLESSFEYIFVIVHGCYSGIMFSLKYFICSLYLVKFTINQETKYNHVKRQLTDLLKESCICVLKTAHWYYLMCLIFGPLLKNSISSILGIQVNEDESFVYNMINLKLLLVTLITGIIISFNWSLYLSIFSAFAAERHIFPVEIPLKGDKNKILSKALTCTDFCLLKYLAVLDLRLLAQHDLKRRQQIFAISHPGGHPHQWKAISEICISSLQAFSYKLYEYSMAAASMDSKFIPAKVPNVMLEQIKSTISEKPLPSMTEKVCTYFREWPAVAYFFDELPNTNVMKLFASSQPLVWMIEALGFLASASYSEDKYGVVQKSLPQIICLFLDLKMAEEKMPVGLVGIRTYVRDPQGRYEHIHQRLSLKTTVNSALCRIAATFKNDINGIYLPEEYRKHFQRYLNRKNS